MTLERKYELYDLEEGVFQLDDNSQSVTGLIEFNKDSDIKDAIVVLRVTEGFEIPHVHILNEHFHTAVKLRTPEYYLHDEAQDKFNDEEVKIFDQFMRKDWVEDRKNFSHWEFAKFMFNRVSGRHQIRLKTQPDYTKLNQ